MAKINYTREDKEILVQILKNYPIIEEKKTDATNIKRKADAWVNVCDEYNASTNGENRNQLQLKRCWDKIKRQRKSDLAEERRERMATGGGSSEKDIDIIPDVDVVAPHLTTEVDNIFDSDATYVTSYEKFKSNSGENSCQPAAESKPSRTPLRGDVSHLCSTSRRNGNIDRLMQIRIENALLEKQHMEELHKIRIEKEKELLEKAKIEKEIAELLLKQKEVEKN